MQETGENLQIQTRRSWPEAAAHGDGTGKLNFRPEGRDERGKARKKRTARAENVG
jgi:hypothetical protein